MSSGTFRSMQRPRLVQQSKVDGGGRGRRVGRREDDDEVKRHGGGVTTGFLGYKFPKKRPVRSSAPGLLLADEVPT